MLHKRAKGNIGEDIACKFLERNGFNIVARNYQKRWGELDVVAQKGGKLNFFEVKSVTVKGDYTESSDSHRPEDNVHPLKMRKMSRMVKTYMMEFSHPVDAEFCFHVLCVYMDMDKRKARVKWIKDVIL
ncbi:MAG: YraN family protein [Patescibacteria group bacterium]|nr:YraN family protein [Patescibacteria group bacterium]